MNEARDRPLAPDRMDDLHHRPTVEPRPYNVLNYRNLISGY